MNEVHLAMLRKRDQLGLDAARNPADGVHVDLDFSGADLRGWDLSGLDLPGANFEGTDLRRAKLNDAGLFGAKFKNAKCQGTQFRGAFAVHAEFEESNLRWSNFSRANLIGSVIWKCDLTNAVFADACIAEPYRGHDDLKIEDCVVSGVTFTGTALDVSCWSPALVELWTAADEARQLDFVMRVAQDGFATSTGARRRDRTLRFPENVLGGDDFVSKDVVNLGNDAPVNPLSSAWRIGALTGQDLLRALAKNVPVTIAE